MMKCFNKIVLLWLLIFVFNCEKEQDITQDTALEVNLIASNNDIGLDEELIISIALRNADSLFALSFEINYSPDLFDVDKLNKRLFFNEYIRLNTYFYGTPYANPRNPMINYDPQKALQILNNAGWTRSNRPIVKWSPDSRKIATFQHDSRGVGMMYLVNTEVGHQDLDAWRYPLPEDSVIFRISRVVLDLDRSVGDRVVSNASHGEVVRSPFNLTTKIVFVSKHGDISSILANGLVEHLEYKHIFSLKGGIQEWISLKNPITK